MDVWTPVQDEMLILRREPTNISDRNAAVLKENQVVGHVPFNLAPSISLFLRRDINKAFAKVAGEKSNIICLWVWFQADQVCHVNVSLFRNGLQNSD